MVLARLTHFYVNIKCLTSRDLRVRVFSDPPTLIVTHFTMPPTTPPLDFIPQPGNKLPTKHKEAIRQLYGFAKTPITDHTHL
jgi:hypothetical protein